jgi:hypothetical protein
MVRELDLEVAALQPPVEEAMTEAAPVAVTADAGPAQAAAIEALERFYRAIVRRRTSGSSAVELAPQSVEQDGEPAETRRAS